MTYTVASEAVKGAIVSGKARLMMKVGGCNSDELRQLSDSIQVSENVVTDELALPLLRGIIIDRLEERLLKLPDGPPHDALDDLEQAAHVYETLNKLTYHIHIEENRVMSKHCFSELKHFARVVLHNFLEERSESLPSQRVVTFAVADEADRHAQTVDLTL